MKNCWTSYCCCCYYCCYLTSYCSMTNWKMSCYWMSCCLHSSMTTPVDWTASAAAPNDTHHGPQQDNHPSSL